jgi:membrane protein YdbS with pleckstrin-like domain
MTAGFDPAGELSAIERWVHRLLAVSAAPEPPDGSPDSIQIFHAGRNYYIWCVIMWALACVGIFAGLASLTIGLARPIQRAPGWVQLVLLFLLAFAWGAFVFTAITTFVARRLTYRLRWYIVTDRSLRIRHGVFHIQELTMTYGNIQEIRVSGGPLQRALGLADVEVQAAGGGGGDKHNRRGNTGRFEGLSNADAIRDLLVERLRAYRDSGLGEMAHHHAEEEGAADIRAAKQVLEEARARRASLLPATR